MKTRSDRGRAAAALAAAALLVAFPRAVRAADEATDPSQKTTSSASSARDLYEEGSRHYHAGEFEQATVLFERAYALSGAPALLLNLAQAYRLRGPAFCGQAQSLYRRYLNTLPTTDRRGEVEKRIAEMEACTRAGISQVPTEGAAAAAPQPGTSAPAASVSAPQATPAEQPEAAEAPRARRPLLVVGYVGIGVGALGLAAAGIAGGIALSQQSSLADVCRGDGGCPPSETSRIDAYERTRAVAIGASIVGVVAAGVGITALVIGSQRTAEVRGRSASVRVVWTGSGASIQGAF